MKARDIVEVSDGSYSMTLVKGEMHHVNGFDLFNRRFRLLSFGAFPTQRTHGASGTNDIMLVDEEDPDFVLFTQERFCHVVIPVTPAIPDQPPLEITIPRETKSVHLILQ